MSTNKKNIGDSTRLIHAARNTSEQGWMVNPPIYQTSTIVFPTLNDLQQAEKSYENSDLNKPYELKYGRYGTQTNFALEQAIAEIENGYTAFTTSCGASAINTALIAFLEQGDHMLIVDNTYSPTRGFADIFLKRLGVKTTYYDPRIGSNIESLIQENTKLIFMESPGSLSFEMQDIPAICQVAKKHNVITIVDNTWSSGIYFKPLNHGADVCVSALTKYINGHSDAMMGAIIVNKERYKIMYESFKYMAVTASPHSAYLVQRGLRTAKIRMDHAYKSAVELAQWLESRSEVEAVLYPALESHPDHQLWKEQYSGAAALFSIVLDKKYTDNQLANMVDHLDFYAMGYSWGGYESLILPVSVAGIRTATSWEYGDKTTLRISVGLEDIKDLKEDLEAGLERLKQ
ncbi:MAG: cystathionine beta-lyase [Rickettsiales bacterium]|nr:cystathionine beta-lyase [Rickettsiales bacterium]